MKKTIPVLLSCFVLGLPISAMAAKKDISFQVETYEIYKQENGEEIKFKTTTPKPQMTFEEDVIVVNSSDKRTYNDVSYKKYIGQAFRFIEFKETSGIEAKYSSDGINYHSDLNKDMDKHIQIKVKEIKAGETIKFNYRFTHSMFNGYND